MNSDDFFGFVSILANGFRTVKEKQQRGGGNRQIWILKQNQCISTLLFATSLLSNNQMTNLNMCAREFLSCQIHFSQCTKMSGDSDAVWICTAKQVAIRRFNHTIGFLSFGRCAKPDKVRVCLVVSAFEIGTHYTIYACYALQSIKGRTEKPFWRISCKSASSTNSYNKQILNAFFTDAIFKLPKHARNLSIFASEQNKWMACG